MDTDSRARGAAALRHQKITTRARVAERRTIVAANVLAGASYRDIAAALNVGKSTVAKDFKAVLEEWREKYTQAAGEWADIQLRRLDVLFNAIWEAARRGDLAAIDRALKIIERQNQILGIGLTSRLAIGGSDGQPIEHRIVIERIADETEDEQG